MWRRLGKEDFAAHVPSNIEAALHHSFTWPVYRSYKLVRQDGNGSYMVAVEGNGDLSWEQWMAETRQKLSPEIFDVIFGPVCTYASQKAPRLKDLIAMEASRALKRKGAVSKYYRPLVDTPHLFLEFSRLAECKDSERAVEEWIFKYGLLGLSRQEPRGFREDLPEVELLSLGGHEDLEYFATGGPGEPLAVIREEASIANEVVMLYEAATSREKDKLERALLKGAQYSTAVNDLRELCRLKAKSAGGASYLDVLVSMAIKSMFLKVQEVLEKFTYPSIAVDLPPSKTTDENGFVHLTRDNLLSPEPLYSPHQLYAFWQPRNLLGAMYLQFYWLITSAGETSRCKYCNRIISHSPPMPGSGERKPNKNKQFCNHRCRQNYHYQNRVKPDRKKGLR
jgi:hypothetical protein